MMFRMKKEISLLQQIRKSNELINVHLNYQSNYEIKILNFNAYQTTQGKSR